MKSRVKPALLDSPQTQGQRSAGEHPQANPDFSTKDKLAHFSPVHSDFARIYHRAVRAQLAMIPNWPPSSPLSLGDFGLLDHDRGFSLIGNIRSFGIDSRATPSTQQTVDVEVCVGRKSVREKEIRLEGQEQIYLRARGCKCLQLTALDTLANTLDDLRQWNKDWIVVTSLLEAKSTTVIVGVGGSHCAQVFFDEDKSGVMSIMAQENVGLFFSMRKAKPLFVAARLSSNFFFRDPRLEAV